MKAKGVIRQQVQWAESRTFFYWRLRRRLLEFSTVNECGAQAIAGERKQAIALLRDWFLTQAGGDEAGWEDDRGMVEWFQEHEAAVKAYTAGVRSAACVQVIGTQLSELVRAAGSNDALDSSSVLKQALSRLSEAERAEILNALK